MIPRSNSLLSKLLSCARVVRIGPSLFNIYRARAVYEHWIFMFFSAHTERTAMRRYSLNLTKSVLELQTTPFNGIQYLL